MSPVQPRLATQMEASLKSLQQIYDELLKLQAQAATAAKECDIKSRIGSSNPGCLNSLMWGAAPNFCKDRGGYPHQVCGCDEGRPSPEQPCPASQATRLLTKSLDLYELATLEIQRAVVAVWQRKRKGSLAERANQHKPLLWESPL